MGNKEKLNSTVYIVFISLLLDLLAFTMILPLMPSLLEHYRQFDNKGLYLWLTQKIKYFQELVGAPEEFNSVLFGGFLGSMFSFLQFIASPIVGGISDVIGRKRVMIICLVLVTCYFCETYNSFINCVLERCGIFLCYLGTVKQFVFICIGPVYWRYK